MSYILPHDHVDIHNRLGPPLYMHIFPYQHANSNVLWPTAYGNSLGNQFFPYIRLDPSNTKGSARHFSCVYSITVSFDA